MKKKVFFFLFVLLSSSGFGQATDVELKLTLRDGNVVSGTSKVNTISLATDYGKLEIPVKNVSSLDIGITPDQGNADKITNLVKQLGNSNEAMRKSAYDELIQQSIKAIPVITDFIYSSKFESSTYKDYTVDAALSELQSKHNVEAGFSSKDVIAVDYEYSIGGTYDFAKIDLKTEYGTLSIPKEKIKHIDVMYASTGDAAEMNFKLLGTKHISSNPNGGWLKTGIMVKAGQKITITATGEITFASLSNAKYKPDGSVVGTPASAGLYEGECSAASLNTYPSYGNVVYKINENSTQVLKAGAKFTGAMPSAGMLYISIYETVYNVANAGTYSVKISMK